MFRRFRRACGRLRFRCPAACRRFRGMGCMFCAMGCMFRRPEPGFRVPGRAGVRGACFFFCPLCAVCQPFAFPRKNILKKSAKKFGPYGEVVVPLHPISGKKSRGRERSLEALHGTTTEVQEERDRHWRPFSGRVVRKRLRLGPELCPEIRSERCPVRARHGPRVPGAVQAWQCRPFFGGAEIFLQRRV